MPEHLLPDTYEVDGRAIKRLRDERGLRSAGALAELSGVSRNTAYRALRGNHVSKSSLLSLANALRVSPKQLINQSHSSIETTPQTDVSGQWLAYFVESFIDKEPSVVEAEVDWEQRGQQITGRDIVQTPDGTRVEEYHDFSLFDDVLIGSMQVMGWEPPAGTTRIQAKLSRNGDRAEGYSIWYDLDSDEVCSSRCVYIRKDSPDFRRLRRYAQKAMQKEVELYRLRAMSESVESFRQALVSFDSLRPDRIMGASIPTQIQLPDATKKRSKLQISGPEFVLSHLSGYGELLRLLLQLDYDLLGLPDPEPAQSIKRWALLHEQFPDHWRLLVHGAEVVGEWHVLPLRPNAARKARTGELVEADIVGNDIDPMNTPGLYSVYVPSFLCQPKYRSNGFRLLLSSLLAQVNHWASNGALIDEVVIVAVTVETVELCEHMGMARRCIHQHMPGNVPVYTASFTAIAEHLPIDGYEDLLRVYRRL